MAFNFNFSQLLFSAYPTSMSSITPLTSTNTSQIRFNITLFSNLSTTSYANLWLREARSGINFEDFKILSSICNQKQVWYQILVQLCYCPWFYYVINLVRIMLLDTNDSHFPYIPGVSFVVLLASSYDVTYDNTATMKSGSVVVPVVTAEPYTRIFIPFAPRLLTRSVLQMASRYIYYLMLSFQ